MNRPNVRSEASIASMLRFALMALAASALLVGCGPKEEPLAQVNTGSSSEQSSPDGSPDATPIDPNDAQRQIEDFAKPKESLHVIDPPVHGNWKPAPRTAEVVEKGLGELIDEGFANIQPTFVNVRIQCLDRGATLNMNPQIKIEDHTKFNIQYGLPETESWINSAVADGKSRVILAKGKQNKLPPFKEVRKADPMNLAQIEEFIGQMPIKGFSAFTEDVAPWDGFVRGLQDPKNGFKVTVTEQKAAPVGQERPFYRLVAKRDGQKAMDVEIIVDSKRNVPVTFRGHITYPDNKSRKLVWQAAWSFGGEFEARDFRIPGGK